MTANTPHLLLIIYENGGNLSSCLSSIDESANDIAINLYCFHNDNKKTAVLREQCGKILDKGKISSFELLSASPNISFEEMANRVIIGEKSKKCQEDFLFFLSSSVLLEANVLARMAKILAKDKLSAGLNPLMLAGWNEKVKDRIAHLGIVCDCQKYLHFLYEGLPVSNRLSEKKRFFQISHPGAVMLRMEDFIKLGGFNSRLEYLAWHDFCIRLKGMTKGFSTVADCRALQTNEFDSWEFCGIWNSAMQRGRLLPAGLDVDYPFIVQEDKLEYGIDAWLCEDVKNLPLDAEKDSSVDEWLAWRHSPNPLSLVKYLSALPPEAMRAGFETCTALPSSLPGTYEYFRAQCAKIEKFAHDAKLEALEAQARDWIKKGARFHHGLLKPGMKLLQKSGIYNCSLDWSTSVYKAWVEVGETFKEIKPGKSWPEIAVLVPVWNPKPEFLIQAINSVRVQKYPNWQLCIADDASTNPEIAEILRNFAGSDKRISVNFRETNGHICRASNSALELVKAPYTAFLDHDDMLAPEALGMVADKFAQDGGLQFVYSDEDHIDCDNIRSSPIFKPDFDCDLFSTGHLSTIGSDILRKSGGLRTGLEGSQDYDLALRIAEMLSPEQISHIPHIIYHWRIHESSTAGSLAAKPYVLVATKKARLDSAKRRGRDAEIAETGVNNFYILAYKYPPNHACSLILLADEENPSPNPELAASISELAQNTNLEICLQPLGKTLPKPDFGLPCKVLPPAGNGWVKACNAAASRAKGPLLLFLYAGLLPLPNCRAEQLIIEAAREDIAMVGGLIWRNGRLANGGWYPDVTGLPFQLLRGVPHSRLAACAWGQFLMPRHTIGVSWQCMALRKGVALDGKFLDESFGELALVDYSLRKQHLHTLASPWGQWENGKPCAPASDEMEKVRERWGETIARHGLRNANLRAAPDDDWTLIFESGK